MRPLTAEDEATLRAIAERHGFYAARGPHTGRVVPASLSTRCSPVRSSRSPSAPLIAAAWSPGSTRRRPPRATLPPSYTAWPHSCARPSPRRPRHRCRAPHARRPRRRQRHPLPRAALVAVISIRMKRPVAWTSAPHACRSWPAPARSGARSTTAGRSQSGRSPASRPSGTATRCGSPSRPKESESGPHAASGPPSTPAPDV